jgi:predicted acyltransferase
MYASEPNNPQGRIRVIILGLILLILGFVFGISILWTIGIILLVVGAVLYLLGATGRAVGGRNHYY